MDKKQKRSFRILLGFMAFAFFSGFMVARAYYGV